MIKQRVGLQIKASVIIRNYEPLLRLAIQIFISASSEEALSAADRSGADRGENS
jgi:hypothetical protein